MTYPSRPSKRDIELNNIDDIEKLPVTFTYAGESNQISVTKMDHWRVIVDPVKWGDTPFMTDYFTGLGHRKIVPFAPPNGYKKNTVAYKQWEDRYVKPSKPTVADLMYCLLNDCRAAECNFADWCDEYGYSSDSMEAMETYKKCLENARGLTKCLGMDVIARLTTLLADY